MTWRTNVKLLALAVVLTLYYRFFENDAAPWERLGKVFPNLQSSELVEIELSRPSDEADAEHGVDTRPILLRYEKVDNDLARWWIVEPIKFPAFHPRVQGLIYELVDMARVAEVQGDAASVLAGAPVLRVRFKTRSDEETVVEVGRDHPDTSLDFCYVRVGDELFVTKKEFRKNLRATLTELRSRSLLPVAYQDTVAFTIRSGDASIISVVKEEDTQLWRLTEPLRTLADREITEALLTDLNSWAVVEFVSDSASAASDLETYGLANPRFVVTVKSGDGRVVTLEIGKDVKEETGREAGEPRVYVRHANLPYVFSATATPLKDIARPAEEFRSRYVFDLQVAEVEVLKGELLRDPGAGLKFSARRLEIKTEERRAGQNVDSGSYVWQIEDEDRSETFRGDRELIENLVRDLRKLRVEKFLQASELEPAGLDAPRARWTLELDSGRVVQLLLGNRSTDPLDQGANVYYGSRPDAEGGYLLLTRLPIILEEGVHALRERKISRVEAASVVEVQIRHDERTWSLMRPPGEKEWSLPADTLAPGMRVKTDLLEDLCAQFQRDIFRVVRYLPDERNLELRDLTPARAPWIVSLRTDGNETKPQRLLIGQPIGGSRPLEYYARFDREGVPVFVLEQDIPDLLRKIHSHLQAITVK